jgi:hypothetical protein
MRESDHALAPIAPALGTRLWQNVDIERVQIDRNDCEQLPSVERLRNLQIANVYKMPLDPRLYHTMLTQPNTRRDIHTFITLKDSSMGLKSGE